ncbi:hypothetical protein JWJ90_13020 [Desulfobulbus rhabdoformis]|jgi:lysine 2,3-aminomutase|uniref:hypothetical protein n=1 Tax=Desulfobulbus rhabdoformis TaxID=34032 RepID=UPI0019622E13|nr:hypothetical protein [Desulfobulbus rhabdoformis]MBM9615202.1 hypothetical protein [Desulfobulbus rhabdoformis]
MAALIWVVFRGTIWALRNMFSIRSEELAGFSLLAYLDSLIQGNHTAPAPSSGFIAEMLHLMKGIRGLADLNTEKAPEFRNHGGRIAVTMRSSDFSSMARKAQECINMDDELIR